MRPLSHAYFGKPYELTQELQKIDVQSLRQLTTNLGLSIINEKGKKKRSKSLIELILNYWKNNNCSLDNPCQQNKLCHVDSGKCLSKQLVKKQILNPRTGEFIQVVGTEEQIDKVEKPIITSTPPPPTDDVIMSYLTESYKKEGMTDVASNGNCFFECISNLVRLTTDPSSNNNSNYYRQKISDTTYLLTQGDNPIIPPINLLFENMSGNLPSNPDNLTNEEIDNNVTSYINTMKKDKEWAGEPEIIASCNLFNKIIIIRHLQKFIPDSIYFPDKNIRSGKSLLPGYWILYHVDINNKNISGNHYQYNNKLFRSGTITNLDDLFQIIKKIDITQEVTPSMSIITKEGKTFAGSSEDLQNFSSQTGLELAFSSSDNIVLPTVTDSITQPNEDENEIENLLNKNIDTKISSELQNDINSFLYN